MAGMEDALKAAHLIEHLKRVPVADGRTDLDNGETYYRYLAKVHGRAYKNEWNADPGDMFATRYILAAGSLRCIPCVSNRCVVSLGYDSSRKSQGF